MYWNKGGEITTCQSPNIQSFLPRSRYSNQLNHLTNKTVLSVQKREGCYLLYISLGIGDNRRAERGEENGGGAIKFLLIPESVKLQTNFFYPFITIARLFFVVVATSRRAKSLFPREKQITNKNNFVFWSTKMNNQPPINNICLNVQVKNFAPKPEVSLFRPCLTMENQFLMRA